MSYDWSCDQKQISTFCTVQPKTSEAPKEFMKMSVSKQLLTIDHLVKIL